VVLIKIAQALNYDGWGGIDSTSLERGVGGREGALINLSKEWARQGHEVTNFTTTPKPERIYEGDGFYEFVPFKLSTTMLATFPYDACVAWECPEVFADERVVERNPVRLVEMQCAHLAPQQRADAAAEFATGVVGLSQWHVDFLAHEGVEGPFYVLPNGIDLSAFPDTDNWTIPSQHKFVYSSSPDRGLWNLLRAWPLMRQQWPDAELRIAYGLKNWLANAIWAHSAMGEMAVEISHLMRQDGVIDMGKLSHAEVAQLHLDSSALAYPCDTMGPTETGCITIIEAMAAHKPVITTDCDCLAEEFEPAALIVPLPFDPVEYVEAVASVLEDESVYYDLCARGRKLAEGRQWRDIAQRWIELFQSQS
jgi:glycosyltransferase involved in cell wall biosynthesis